MNAFELINEIVDNLDISGRVEVRRIKDALEDGVALASLGPRDEDQAVVEEAHGICTSWIKEGREFL